MATDAPNLSSRGAIDRLAAAAKGAYVPPPKARFDPREDALFGGVCGLSLPIGEVQLAPGLSLVSTYAHLMAPVIMAFARPERPSAPHPGPWAALEGRGYDVTTEVRLEARCAPLGFDRLNTLWFVVAMLRLRLALPLHMPVLADRPLKQVPADVDAANLVSMERHLAPPITSSRRTVEQADLVWIARYISAADRLMVDPVFNRAFLTLDRAVAIDNPGAGIVIAWAAIETLLRPGGQRITDRLTRSLATYLHPPGPDRDRAFGEIVRSYEARGGAAHAGALPEAAQFQTAFRLARAALVVTIETGALPDIGALLERWASKT